MLKINAIGNVTNDPELRRNESTGKTYCVIRIACDRRYRDRDGNKLTDFISVKVRDNLALRMMRAKQVTKESLCTIQGEDVPDYKFTPPPQKTRKIGF